MGRLRAAALAAATLACVAAPAASASAAPPATGSALCRPRTAPPATGLTLLRRAPVDARVTDLTLHSEAMRGPEHVDVLLPAGYDPSGSTRYPVLYLLHGATGSYSDWVRQGDVEALVGGRPLIVVMPDDSADGSYSDWFGSSEGDPDAAPAWESFHIDELIPWIDRTYPTVAARAGRAVAGLSSGGDGAMKYAARHPEVFAAAGEFSGAVDTDLDYPVYPVGSTLGGVPQLLPGAGPSTICTWGDPLTEDVVWRTNDPTYLASNLHGVALYLATGDGLPGPHDSPADPASVGTLLLLSAVEAVVWRMNVHFIAALDAAGVPHTDNLYGPGVHSWPYWQDDLRAFLPWMAARLDGPAAPPADVDIRSAESRFSAWGWRFTTHRLVREFTYLTGVGLDGMAATGSGSLHVDTPPLYTPGALYVVDAGGRPVSLRADRSGSLHLDVDLGPSHTRQQDDFSAGATDGWRRVEVSIRPASARPEASR